ncbi:MAG: hypothetical protein ACK55I_02855, partial [bacterium]
MRVVRQGAVEYPELAEEHRSVQFLVDGSAQIFRVERTRDSSERLAPLSIPVGHIVTCDTACTSGVTASIDGRALRVDGDGAMYTMLSLIHISEPTRLVTILSLIHISEPTRLVTI